LGSFVQKDNIQKTQYSQTCVQRPPLGLRKSGYCLKVKGTGGRYSQFISIKLLTVLENLGSSWLL
jgi:hypothetical protein